MARSGGRYSCCRGLKRVEVIQAMKYDDRKPASAIGIKVSRCLGWVATTATILRMGIFIRCTLGCMQEKVGKADMDCRCISHPLRHHIIAASRHVARRELFAKHVVSRLLSSRILLTEIESVGHLHKRIIGGLRLLGVVRISPCSICAPTRMMLVERNMMRIVILDATAVEYIIASTVFVFTQIYEVATSVEPTRANDAQSKSQC